MGVGCSSEWGQKTAISVSSQVAKWEQAAPGNTYNSDQPQLTWLDNAGADGNCIPKHLEDARLMKAANDNSEPPLVLHAQFSLGNKFIASEKGAIKRPFLHL